MANIAQLSQKRSGGDARRFTGHYHLVTPEEAAEKHGLTVARMRALFRKFGFRMSTRGPLYMHPDTLDDIMREPWKYELVDKKKPARR